MFLCLTSTILGQCAVVEEALRAAYDVLFFFFNDTATTEIYTLSLHDALPILDRIAHQRRSRCLHRPWCDRVRRSEEHTSELQSRPHLVCRLLLEKKKKRS